MRKAAGGPSQGQPFLVNSQKGAESSYKAVHADDERVPDGRPESRGPEARFDDSERSVYERIARYAAIRNES